MQGSGSLEMWAGIECTVNRVADAYYDQVAVSGHADRISDLDRFCDLGIKAIRYPVIWERTQPVADVEANWDWSDQRLNLLHRRSVRPIVGLVHHGSGPSHTSLIESTFAEKLAVYAARVAQRYPWVDAYTPVNEPHTTARFSALYGHWYPHACDGRLFVNSLMTQCRATVLAMRAIRAVNPEAQLIQTDDLGKTFSTPTLAYQADFDNERRWISWDLLCGRVDHNHPLWSYFVWVGADLEQLHWLRDNPCPPDVIGVNHYVTSDRYLDERLARYPARTHGGNSQTQYADVEAVRALPHDYGGIGDRLREAWQRYRIPLAITEVHLGCYREEQLRWLCEVWSSAQSLRSEGVDLRAITAWSLLGSYDWNSLLTRWSGHYEPGVFDLRGSAPRATALAAAVKSLTAGKKLHHPVLETPGWWRRKSRLLYPPEGRGHLSVTEVVGQFAGSSRLPPRPILIAGADGRLGSAFARICAERGLERVALNRLQMDITDQDAVRSALKRIRPWAAVNAAGYTRVDRAESEREACYRSNVAGATVLAEACEDAGIRMISFSSDHVFDGKAERPYVESDVAAPLNVYGKSKLAAEESIAAAMSEALIIRTNSLFGPGDVSNFVADVLCKLRRCERVRAASDAVSSATYIPDLVHATMDLLVDGEAGIWHLGHGGAATWMTLAMNAANAAGVSSKTLEPCRFADLPYQAIRPRYSALGSERGKMLPPLENALERYVRDAAI